ncbi:hypothetical protein J6590_042578 [Homalodisca vitripennis]|nr:hypothetical protein J6590_042578 [Homalodisca vitripennis]
MQNIDQIREVCYVRITEVEKEIKEDLNKGLYNLNVNLKKLEKGAKAELAEQKETNKNERNKLNFQVRGKIISAGLTSLPKESAERKANNISSAEIVREIVRNVQGVAFEYSEK